MASNKNLQIPPSLSSTRKHPSPNTVRPPSPKTSSSSSQLTIGNKGVKSATVGASGSRIGTVGTNHRKSPSSIFDHSASLPVSSGVKAASKNPSSTHPGVFHKSFPVGLGPVAGTSHHAHQHLDDTDLLSHYDHLNDDDEVMSITESMTRMTPIVMDAAAQSSLHDLIEAQKVNLLHSSHNDDIIDQSYCHSQSVTPSTLIQLGGVNNTVGLTSNDAEGSGSEHTIPAAYMQTGDPVEENINPDSIIKMSDHELQRYLQILQQEFERRTRKNTSTNNRKNSSSPSSTFTSGTGTNIRRPSLTGSKQNFNSSKNNNNNNNNNNSIGKRGNVTPVDGRIGAVISSEQMFTTGPTSILSSSPLHLKANSPGLSDSNHINNNSSSNHNWVSLSAAQAHHNIHPNHNQSHSSSSSRSPSRAGSTPIRLKARKVRQSESVSSALSLADNDSQNSLTSRNREHQDESDLSAVLGQFLNISERTAFDDLSVGSHSSHASSSTILSSRSKGAFSPR